ncbi:MAG: hypothetical protein DRP42_01450 [Tenericutes bacterium]|nr:MAG: hypothetical protein DRP42_01450 [Mycoplasmatota bacterium]
MAIAVVASEMEFMECTSLQIHYDVMGIATVSFTLVSNKQGLPDLENWRVIEAGGQTFTGHVTNLNMQSIPKTSWFETHVTLVTTTN